MQDQESIASDGTLKERPEPPGFRKKLLSWIQSKIYRARFIRLIVVPTGLIGGVISVIELAKFFSGVFHKEPDDRSVLAYMVFFCFVTLAMIVIWIDGHVRYRVDETMKVVKERMEYEYGKEFTELRTLANLVSKTHHAIIGHYRDVIFKYHNQDSVDVKKDFAECKYIFQPIFQAVKEVTDHLLKSEMHFRLTIKIRDPEGKLIPIYRSENMEDSEYETEKNLLFEYFRPKKSQKHMQHRRDLIIEDIEALPKMSMADLEKKFAITGSQLHEMIGILVKRAANSGYNSLYAVPIYVYVPMKRDGIPIVDAKFLIGFVSLDASQSKYFNNLEKQNRPNGDGGVLTSYYSIGDLLGCLVYQLNLCEVKKFLSPEIPEENGNVV